MRRIDELHLEFPFAGSRLLCDLLAAEGSKIGRRHVTTLMKRMGIEALYRRPRTTKPEPGHKVYPYLLRGAAITRPNQVWGDGYHLHPDGARLRLPGRCAGLVQSAGSVVARVDHHGGSILRRDVGGGAGEARQAGDLQHRQGSQFTGAAFTGLLIKNGIAIGMDGKGAWRDNVFVERLWRSVKYEEVYLSRLRQRIRGPQIDWSLSRLLQPAADRTSSLDRSTPDQAYFTPLPIRMAA
jgi:putative transposase